MRNWIGKMFTAHSFIESQSITHNLLTIYWCNYWGFCSKYWKVSQSSGIPTSSSPSKLWKQYLIKQKYITPLFPYNQIKIYLTPSNTFPSHSRLLLLSVWIDPSPFSIISINFLLWAETSRLFIHVHQNTLILMMRGIKRSWAWLRLVDLNF